MKLSRVIGTVVLSQCVAPYIGIPLHLTQALGLDLDPAGDPEVSGSWKSMHEGDLVIVEVSREACNAFEPPVALDSVIIGKVDAVHLEGAGEEG